MPLSFGDRFKALRKAKFIKQDDFRAKYAQMFGEDDTPTQASLSYWESGKTAPTFMAGCKAAAVLGVSVYELSDIGAPIDDTLNNLPEDSQEALGILTESHLQALEKIRKLEAKVKRLEDIWEIIDDAREKEAKLS